MMKSFGVAALFLGVMPARAMAASASNSTETVSASNSTDGAAQDMKSSLLPNLDSILNRFYVEFEESGRRLMEFKPPASMLMTPSGNAIVEVVGKGTTAELRTAMQDLNLEVTGCFSLVEGACSVIAPVSQFAMLSGHSQVQSVTSNLVQSQASGSVGSLASESMFADEARRIFHVDGHGTKVCVLSDSFNCIAALGEFAVTSAEDDVRLGDLPSFDRMDIVRDLTEDGCSDEGRAMMQLIHDVAPGADLGFYTAFLGLSAFAEGIVELVHVGCDVIVDDVIYFAEAMYQDDLVAQAADYANDMGVPYFSSAGNANRDSWEGPWNEVSGTFRPRLDFTDGDGGEATSLQVRAIRDTLVIMQWPDPKAYASGLPGPKTDLDILLEVDGFSAGGGFDSNPGTGEPFELVELFEGNTYDIVIQRFSGPQPEFVKLVFFGAVERVSSNGDPSTISAGTSYGHANAEGAIAVGAAPYIRTPGFGVSPAIPEVFSSAGGVPILLDLQGERLDKEAVRQTPAFTAPDGTCTNFFGAFDLFETGVTACYNFFGTSAAAPNAAAVAALMLQVQPRLQPEDIRGIMVRTAEDMDDPATTWFDHGFDATTGSGFLNALYAVGESALPLSDCKHGKGGGKGGKGSSYDRRNLSEVVGGVEKRRRLDTSKESKFDLTKLPRSYHEVDPRRGRSLEGHPSQTSREESEDAVASKKTIRGA